HATALLNLLRGDLIRRAPGPWRDGVLLLVALIAGVGTAAVGGERRGLLLFSGLLVAYPLAALGAFHAGLVWFDTIVPLSVAALSYGTAAYLHYRRTGRLKRQLRATFDHVLQPALIDHLLSDPRRLILGGESRRLSILFTDLQNSTALSESLPAEEWVARLNRYFSRGTGVVLSHNAYLDKFIGDGLMAVWGAPVPLESHEEEACRAVVELRQALGEVEEAIHREHGVRLVTRMGLNSGEVIAGMVGSEGLSHYTVLGDPVVVASRLEGANKFFGTRTLIGESTWARSRGVVEGREIDLVVLKGKSKAIKIYEPLAFRGELDERGRLLVERYGRALELYRARRFKEAIVELEALLERVPDDGPSKVLVERARALLDAEPPEEWAGEHVLASK
ncbi:MAG TPA: adenylate/guanylate cyclase domain-containing protein, partial [Planctomycetota bacterium]|nr:adenylate/guanylate cyclase domain-containing protein [Planctomycetota bacterium]